jgi:hypothetical protein
MTTGVHSISCNAVKQLAREVGKVSRYHSDSLLQSEGRVRLAFLYPKHDKAAMAIQIYTSSHEKVERFAMRENVARVLTCASEY